MQGRFTRSSCCLAIQKAHWQLLSLKGIASRMCISKQREGKALVTPKWVYLMKWPCSLTCSVVGFHSHCACDAHEHVMICYLLHCRAILARTSSVLPQDWLMLADYWYESWRQVSCSPWSCFALAWRSGSAFDTDTKSAAGVHNNSVVTSDASSGYPCFGQTCLLASSASAGACINHQNVIQ